MIDVAVVFSPHTQGSPNRLVVPNRVEVQGNPGEMSLDKNHNKPGDHHLCSYGSGLRYQVDPVINVSPSFSQESPLSCPLPPCRHQDQRHLSQPECAQYQENLAHLYYSGVCLVCKELS